MSRDYPGLVLRVGVAFAFIYPAVSAFFAPDLWIGYIPSFVGDALGREDAREVLLHVFGALEIGIGLWLLAGRKIFIPSVLATAILFLIVVFNYTQLDVLFRDVSIMLMAAALAIVHRPRDTTPPTL